MTNVILIFILIMSTISFFVMGYDKSQARKQARRISEKNLWTLAVLGGGIGAYIGMQLFRHKTKHTNFRVGFLMLMILYTILIFYILTKDSTIIA